MILLEWDPAKRGRALDKNKEQEIVVFDFIDDILSKKVRNCFMCSLLQLILKILILFNTTDFTFILDCKCFLRANISELELRD